LTWSNRPRFFLLFACINRGALISLTHTGRGEERERDERGERKKRERKKEEERERKEKEPKEEIKVLGFGADSR